jgi:hypothetical protein
MELGGDISLNGRSFLRIAKIGGGCSNSVEKA